MIAVADPFMAGQPVRIPGDFYRSKQGTPYVSDPTGATVKTGARKGMLCRVPYKRPSGFGDIVEDMYSVWKWSERQEALGFALAPDLAEAAKVLIVDDQDTPEWRHDADKIVVAAKAVAKAGIASERGSHAHLLTEDDDEGRDIITRIEAGEDLGLSESVQRSLVDAWRAMLARDGLEILATEAAVVHDGYRCAGTLDRIARLTKPLRFALITGEIVELSTDTVVILDIKSGKRRLRTNGTVMYWQSYAVQVAVYAGGLPYDTDTDTRGKWPFKINQRWAVIAHLDVLGALDGNPSCELVLVDITAGRRAADLCLAAKTWEADTTVFSVAQIVEAGGMGAAASPTTPSASTPDVEGEMGTECCSTGRPSPSTPVSPPAPMSAAVNAGGVGSSADQPPHPPATTETDVWTVETTYAGRAEALAWASQPAPTPLAPLPDHPDEGEGGWDFHFLESQYKALMPVERAWIARLVSEAQQAGVGFHTQRHRTARRYWIIEGLVALANHHVEAFLTKDTADDDVLRALCVAALGIDAPLDPRHTAGKCVGSLDAAAAQRFATLVDDYVGTSVYPNTHIGAKPNDQHR